jgi:hapalindole-type alkaloid chlorinase
VQSSVAAMNDAHPFDAWLARIGLSRGTCLGPWRLTAVEGLDEATGAGVLLDFSSAKDPQRSIRAELRTTDWSRPAFARTASFDLTYREAPPAMRRSVMLLMHVIYTIVNARDPGGLGLPPPEADAAGAAPTGAAGGGAYANASAREPDDQPALRVSGEDHFLDWRIIDIDELDAYPDAIHEMVQGRRGGLIIRRAFSRTHMERVVARLEGGERAFQQTFFPPQFKAYFFGRCLDGSDPELAEYLDAAARFHEDTRAAFTGGEDFETHLEEVLRRIAGGRTVSVPRFRDGRAYAAATIRVLPPGGQIGTHCGNEASTRPAYTHLNTLVDLTDQVSYFLTLQHPEAGGELVVYSLKWDEIDGGLISHGRSNVDALLPRARWEAYRPEAGDLLVFDGGRYFHRVAVVRGARTRWTIGGFMMIARDGKRFYYWS